MRLLTHNLLACLKCNAYPLSIHAEELNEIEVEYDPEFTRRMLGRIHYEYLRDAFNKIRAEHLDVIKDKCAEDLPLSLTRNIYDDSNAEVENDSKEDEVNNNDKANFDNSNENADVIDNANNCVIVDLSDNSTLLHNLHYALNVIAVRNGYLECPECKLTYAVKEYIPNFVLDEHK